MSGFFLYERHTPSQALHRASQWRGVHPHRGSLQLQPRQRHQVRLEGGPEDGVEYKIIVMKV